MRIIYTIPNELKSRRGQEVMIMGEFNEWVPQLMEEITKDTFTYQTNVIPGLKYRYQFIVNGDITIDQNE